MRQRNVFPTDEIAHLWAHKSQPSARNAGHNFYFDGDTIYSYGSHFPIARHVSNGKQSAILFTTRGYSVTTSKHLSLVRRAIPSGMTVFYVPNVSDYHCHGDNLKAYVQDSEQTLINAIRSRKYGTSLLNEAFGYRDEARKYAKFFRAPMPRFPFLPKSKTLDGLKEKLKAKEAKQAAKDKIRRAKEQAAWDEQQRIRAIATAEKMADWCAGNSIDTYLLRDADTQLRIVGDAVETSRGARVPIDHARFALKAVRRVLQTGKEFVTNGHTIHVGHYKLDRITADGTVYAGCHVIKLDAIERIASQLDAMEVQS